jgi:hypothetical protein
MAVAAAQAPVGTPGAVNLIEGQVALEGKAILPGSLEGVAAGAGQTLSTEQGKAELLLTPGAFLWLGEQSAVKMTSLAAADTQVELVRGAALLEVVQPATGRLQVLNGDSRVTIGRPGIYEFHAGQPAATIRFSRTAAASDALYAWSQQRAEANARASIDTAQALVGTDPTNFRSPGWYWNPFYGEWGFLPATYTMTGPFGEQYFSARFYWQYAGVETHVHGYFTPAQ